MPRTYSGLYRYTSKLMLSFVYGERDAAFAPTENGGLLFRAYNRPTPRRFVSDERLFKWS